jgi:lipopolysaccharide export system permease protein
MTALSPTLCRYFAKHYLLWLALITGSLAALIFTVDILELLRRGNSREGLELGLVFKMAGFKLPYTAEKIFPFAVLFASMASLYKLTRAQELVVVRAAGVSVWQFLLPFIVVAFVMGCLQITLLNPLGAALLARYNTLEDKKLQGGMNRLSFGSNGLWFRQKEQDGGYSVFHAKKLNVNGTTLENVMILRFSANQTFTSRYDITKADLTPKGWILQQGWQSAPNQLPFALKDPVLFPATITRAELENSFAAPQTLSVWSLPSFIRLLESAGFSATRHRLHLQTLLLTPFLYIAMVLIAAMFSLRLPRRGRALKMLVGGITAGFLLYFVSDLVAALGLSDRLPVFLAVWTPTIVVLLCAISVLLGQEDG